MARKKHHLTGLEILVLLLTLMQEKLLLLKEFYSIQVYLHKIGEVYMKVLQQWTGWNKEQERGITITSTATTCHWTHPKTKNNYK